MKLKKPLYIRNFVDRLMLKPFKNTRFSNLIHWFVVTIWYFIGGKFWGWAGWNNDFELLMVEPGPEVHCQDCHGAVDHVRGRRGLRCGLSGRLANIFYKSLAATLPPPPFLSFCVFLTVSVFVSLISCVLSLSGHSKRIISMSLLTLWPIQVAPYPGPPPPKKKKKLKK